MTKQEELEEWVNKYLTERFIGVPNEFPKDECQKEARTILSHIASKGGVLKVARGLPQIPRQFRKTIGFESIYDSGWRNGFGWLKKKLKAGFVAAEPLVEGYRDNVKV